MSSMGTLNDFQNLENVLWVAKLFEWKWLLSFADICREGTCDEALRTFVCEVMLFEEFHKIVTT